MKIVIPMAGMGKRMRPHTLTKPKPLLDIAGKSIVERLIIDLAQMVDQVDEVAFIIGNFGKEVEDHLIDIAQNLGYTAKIYYQLEAMGTAHALYMARESLQGPVLVAYADTLFSTDFKVDPAEEAYIWVKKISNPEQFGVVVCDEQGYIQRFAEKSKTFVSDMAIIGIYYFREGELLRDEVQFLLDHHITGNGEFQITDALENMRAKGVKIKIAPVEGWYDCGNIMATLDTHRQILELGKYAESSPDKVTIVNSTIIQPCFIGDHTVIIDSEIGPYVSIGNGTKIEKSKISDTIIYNESRITHSEIDGAMIGNNVICNHITKSGLNVGDFSEI